MNIKKDKNAGAMREISIKGNINRRRTDGH